MEQSTVDLLAAAVTSRLSANFVMLIIVQLGLSVLCAAIGAYAGGYLRRRGENLATQQDLSALREQLRGNTAIVETIKGDVERANWTHRQWRQLRIEKLEELVAAVEEVDNQLDQHRYRSIEGRSYEGPDSLFRIEWLKDLYFPQLEDSVYQFTSAARNLKSALLDLAINTSGAANAEDRAAVFASFQTAFASLYSEFTQATSALKKATRAVLLEIVEHSD